MLKFNDLKKVFPKRLSLSHKGQNGKVLIVGGSLDYYGAPILSALGALHSGADLVYLAVPECNFEVTRATMPDFIVRKYEGNYLTARGASTIANLASESDAILFGPGLGDKKETLETIKKLLKEINIPTILDASAIQVLQMMESMPLTQKIIITPHHSEFELLTGKIFKIDDASEPKIVFMRTLATDIKINILLKGPEDIILSEEGNVAKNTTGNAGMTVGGTGDILSGVVASLIAQGATAYDACQIAAFTVGKTGDRLFKEKGFNFTASDLANDLPYIMKEFNELSP